ncbi:hypothetical protein [Streptomyces sp. RKAG290]|uniref:hypothetical protein n=1 Tax=Streptomyces sp. RKAG290 TaxID=2888348 RepID=UPI0020341410|nr:hypothetical protein [Streptomyces sp. RKAG290]MCM2416409.1 hypothetical protein [Streptomyces sp. RKAG290]
MPGSFLAPAVLVIAVIGYYVPLFGLPLLCFLVVDRIVGAARRRHTERAEVAA